MLTAKNTALLVFVLVATGMAESRELPTPPVSAIVASGERTRVGITFQVNPDCSSGGKIITRLFQPPKNGKVEMLTERGFTDYAKDLQTHKCNERESEITAFYYTPQNDFKGSDQFTVEIFFPNGNYRKRVFNVGVR
jgi:hypothetical protein